ncbi:MAG: hypothetical protein ACD_40C00166G0002 [uncultured bacterium]|nr:MAG: hypothetical protein ACD_40C00166G0002 [uncultured bacterium]
MKSRSGMKPGLHTCGLKFPKLIKILTLIMYIYITVIPERVMDKQKVVFGIVVIRWSNILMRAVAFTMIRLQIILIQIV